MKTFKDLQVWQRGINLVKTCSILLSLLILIVSCSNYPTDNSGRDLSELESVWQYLKTYSIWQNNVPGGPFEYGSPEEMMAAIHDTLNAIPYTEYYSGFHSAYSPMPTVSFDSLTDSTALIRIFQFSEDDSSTYFQFLDIMPRITRFSKIIIDLIDNRGGGIAVTDAIINAILPIHTPYIMEMYRKYDYYSRTASTVQWDTIKTIGRQETSLRNKRYAVLTNHWSASASEILIAALKDGFPASKGDTVVLVGETSYGKGIGQIIVNRFLLNRRDLKITFMRMKGISARVGDYFRKGIPPDTLVPVDGQDTFHKAQINAALKFLQPSAHVDNNRAFSKQSQPAHQFPPEAVIVASTKNEL